MLTRRQLDLSTVRTGAELRAPAEMRWCDLRAAVRHPEAKNPCFTRGFAYQQGPVAGSDLKPEGPT